MSNITLKHIRRIDDDLDLAGSVTLTPLQWADLRHAVLTEAKAAAELGRALRRVESLLSHYTYSAENRATLADIRETLGQYTQGNSTNSGDGTRE